MSMGRSSKSPMHVGDMEMKKGGDTGGRTRSEDSGGRTRAEDYEDELDALEKIRNNATQKCILWTGNAGEDISWTNGNSKQDSKNDRNLSKLHEDANYDGRNEDGRSGKILEYPLGPLTATVTFVYLLLDFLYYFGHSLWYLIPGTLNSIKTCSFNGNKLSIVHIILLLGCIVYGVLVVWRSYDFNRWLTTLDILKVLARCLGKATTFLGIVGFTLIIRSVSSTMVTKDVHSRYGIEWRALHRLTMMAMLACGIIHGLLHALIWYHFTSGDIANQRKWYWVYEYISGCALIILFLIQGLQRVIPFLNWHTKNINFGRRFSEWLINLSKWLFRAGHGRIISALIAFFLFIHSLQIWIIVLYTLYLMEQHLTNLEISGVTVSTVGDKFFALQFTLVRPELIPRLLGMYVQLRIENISASFTAIKYDSKKKEEVRLILLIDKDSTMGRKIDKDLPIGTVPEQQRKNLISIHGPHHSIPSSISNSTVIIVISSGSGRAVADATLSHLHFLGNMGLLSLQLCGSRTPYKKDQLDNIRTNCAAKDEEWGNDLCAAKDEEWGNDLKKRPELKLKPANRLYIPNDASMKSNVQKSDEEAAGGGTGCSDDGIPCWEDFDEKMVDEVLQIQRNLESIPRWEDFDEKMIDKVLQIQESKGGEGEIKGRSNPNTSHLKVLELYGHFQPQSFKEFANKILRHKGLTNVNFLVCGKTAIDMFERKQRKSDRIFIEDYN